LGIGLRVILVSHGDGFLHTNARARVRCRAEYVGLLSGTRASTTGPESLPTLPDSFGRVGCRFRFDMASMIDNVARAARSFLLLEML
jgi:hypothetical protein